MLNYKKTEIHGHRGCRGYFPENTLQGFIHALNFEIDALEMDVVISKDHQVVVSHEHYMHHKKCLWPNLSPISKEKELSVYIYQMDYIEVRKFDCGLSLHPNYPQVKSQKAYKPLLKEVINSVELACNENKRKPITYNIEIKSEPNLIGKGQPDYNLYVQLVLDIISSFQIINRVIIQSFDKEILRTIRKINLDIPLSLLIEDQLDPFLHIKQLGFTPTILASEYIYLNVENIVNLHAKGIKVFAFTVNEMEDVKKMLTYGVDAIITDYPDLASHCLNMA